METEAPEGGPPLDRDEWMRRTGPLYPALVAVRELSALPVLRGIEPTADDRVRSAPWFPAIGGLIGGLVGLVALGLLATKLVPAIAGVAALAVAVALSAAVFEVGLARVVDKLAAGDVDDDPYGRRVLGVPGFAAVAAVMALRVILLLGIEPSWWIGALLTSQVVLRWVPVFLLRLGDRLGEALPGERSLLVGPVTWPGLAIGTGFAALCAILFGGGMGALALVVAAAAAFGAGLLFQRRYGGLTSHTLAASAVLCELLVLLVFAASHAAVASPWIG